MISQSDLNILEKFSSRVRARFPKGRIWVFGSRARGDAIWDSDFDIFIVLAQVDREIREWIRGIAWEVGFANECVITTVILAKDEFERGPMSESTLVANILREGVAA